MAGKALEIGQKEAGSDAVKPFGNSQKGNGKVWLTWLMASDKYPPSNNGGKPMHGLKSVVAAATVAAMVGSSALAADRALVPGKPSGVKSAQEIGKGTLIIGLGAAAIITAVAITVSNQSGDRSAPNTFASPSTTSTPP